jgi:Na+-translocating ferredoxin:NAD+ oxidoreductase RnfD subunit
MAFGSGQSWWGALPELGVLGLIALCASGFYIAQRINKLPMIAAFLVAYLSLFTLSAVAASPATVAEVFRTPDLQALLFFAFFMLDDPPTSPVRYHDQVVYGLLVAGASYFVFMRFGVVYFLPAGLLAGNAAEAIRRLLAKRHRARRRRSYPAPYEHERPARAA